MKEGEGVSEVVGGIAETTITCTERRRWGSEKKESTRQEDAETQMTVGPNVARECRQGKLDAILSKPFLLATNPLHSEDVGG